jgi:hypothetical protein
MLRLIKDHANASGCRLSCTLEYLPLQKTYIPVLLHDPNSILQLADNHFPRTILEMGTMRSLGKRLMESLEVWSCRSEQRWLRASPRGHGSRAQGEEGNIALFGQW